MPSCLSLWDSDPSEWHSHIDIRGSIHRGFIGGCLNCGRIVGEHTLAVAKEKEAHKRTWKRGPRERTLQSRVWDRTGLKGKTLWDLLQLLIVPLMLVAIGFWFTTQQEARQQQLEDQRAELERAIEDQRAQQATLQAYLDQMGTLLLDRDLRLHDFELTGKQLLRDTDLTQAGLTGADLSEAHLEGTDLSGAHLGAADLRGAYL
jgi:hypothetical protein